MVSLTFQQSAALGGILNFLLFPNRVFIFGGFENVVVEIEDLEGNTLIRRRIWEDGKVENIDELS